VVFDELMLYTHYQLWLIDDFVARHAAGSVAFFGTADPSQLDAIDDSRVGSRAE
jgi:hypothetical protein